MPQAGAPNFLNQANAGGSGSPGMASSAPYAEGPTQGLAMLLQALGQMNNQNAAAQSQSRDIQANKDLESQRSQNRSREQTEASGQRITEDKARIGEETARAKELSDYNSPAAQQQRTMAKFAEMWKDPSFQTGLEATKQVMLAYGQGQLAIQKELADTRMDYESQLARKKYAQAKLHSLRDALEQMNEAYAIATAAQFGNVQVSDLITQADLRVKKAEQANSAAKTMALMGMGMGQDAAASLARLELEETPKPYAEKPTSFGTNPQFAEVASKTAGWVTKNLPVAQAMAPFARVKLPAETGTTVGTPAPDMSALVGRMTETEYAPLDRKFRAAFGSQLTGEELETVMGLIQMSATGKVPVDVESTGDVNKDMQAWMKKHNLVNGDSVIRPRAFLSAVIDRLTTDQKLGDPTPTAPEALEANAEQGNPLAKNQRAGRPLPEAQFQAYRKILNRALKAMGDEAPPSVIEAAYANRRLELFKQAAIEERNDPQNALKAITRTMLVNSMPDIVEALEGSDSAEAKAILTKLESFAPETVRRIRDSVQSQNFLAEGGTEGLLKKELGLLEAEGTMADRATAKVDQKLPIGGEIMLPQFTGKEVPGQVELSPLRPEFREQLPALKQEVQDVQSGLTATPLDRSGSPTSQPVQSARPNSWWFAGINPAVADTLDEASAAGFGETSLSKFYMDRQTLSGQFNMQKAAEEAKKAMSGAPTSTPGMPQMPDMFAGPMPTEQEKQ